MGQFVSASIQFIGAENVKRAFENVGVVNWALFNGKTLLEKYEGDDQEASKQLFDQYVDSLEANGSMSLYRLQTYEELPAGGKIKPSTEPDRSFQFKLYDLNNQRSIGSPGGGYRDPAMNQILEKLNALESKISILEKDDEPEERVSGIGDTLMKFLEIPAVQQKIGAIFENLADQLIPPKNSVHAIPLGTPAAQQPATLNGVPSDNETVQIEKINAAIQALYTIDKSLGDNLEKLAAIATADPKKYRELITMLKIL